jgi:hypothetical protein
MDEPTPRKPDEYVESERERRIGNLVILAFFLVVLGAGIWLVNAMLEYRAIDDCVAQGRLNCAPVDGSRR